MSDHVTALKWTLLPHEGRGMFEVLIAVSSIATLALLGIGVWLLTRLCRRLRLLEHREQQRVEAQRLVNTPRPNGTPVDWPTEPERRRRHLTLYQGGITAALIAIGASVREAWKANRPLGYTVAAATATTGIVAAVLITNGDSATNGQPPTPTSPAPSATQTPGPSATATRSTPEPSPSKPAPDDPTPTFSPPPLPPAAPSPNGGSTPAPSASSHPPAPAPEPPRPTLPTLPPVPTPTVKPPTKELCVRVNVPPLADINLCLLNAR